MAGTHFQARPTVPVKRSSRLEVFCRRKADRKRLGCGLELMSRFGYFGRKKLRAGVRAHRDSTRMNSAGIILNLGTAAEKRPASHGASLAAIPEGCIQKKALDAEAKGAPQTARPYLGKQEGGSARIGRTKHLLHFAQVRLFRRDHFPGVFLQGHVLVPDQFQQVFIKAQASPFHFK